ncbi:MAG: hypothetical protein J6O41_05065 [Clostridia bacterium]|nr:hypothetical protein [Clostridia bacterium]
MLHLEQLAKANKEFADYLDEYYDVDRFNARYIELLDDFLNPYALNKTEKSD